MRRSFSSGEFCGVHLLGQHTLWSWARLTTRPLRSLSPVGKRALLVHEGCMGVLRHHARATGDATMGVRCRGALAAMEERRSVGAVPGAAAAAAHEDHLMIS